MRKCWSKQKFSRLFHNNEKHKNKENMHLNNVKVLRLIVCIKPSLCKEFHSQVVMVI